MASDWAFYGYLERDYITDEEYLEGYDSCHWNGCDCDTDEEEFEDED